MGQNLSGDFYVPSFMILFTACEITVWQGISTYPGSELSSKSSRVSGTLCWTSLRKKLAHFSFLLPVGIWYNASRLAKQRTLPRRLSFANHPTLLGRWEAEITTGKCHTTLLIFNVSSNREDIFVCFSLMHSEHPEQSLAYSRSSMNICWISCILYIPSLEFLFD